MSFVGTFEEDGPTPGIPLNWYVDETISSFEYAAFDRQDNEVVAPFDQDDGGVNWNTVEVTLTAHVATGPDGVALSAHRIAETVTNQRHDVETADTVSVLAGESAVFETFLKHETAQFAGLHLFDGGEVGAIVDLSTGKIASVSPISGDLEAVGASLTKFPDGWLRLQVFVRQADDAAGPFGVVVRVRFAQNATTFGTYAGNITHTFLMWGVFLRKIPNGLGSKGETFNEWSGLITDDFVPVFTDANTDEASFDAVPGPAQVFEDFENMWSGNEGFTPDLALSASATFDSAGTPDAVEDFEELWLGNESFSPTMGSTTAASFDSAGTPQAFEDFEELWKSNQTFFSAMGATTASSFDTGGTPQAFEDFEETKAPLACTVDPATDIFLCTSHGFSANDRVSFQFVGLDNIPIQPPQGLQPNTIYFIISVDANHFKVSTSSGPGTQVDIVTTGNGVNYVVADQTKFWVSQITV